MITAKNGVRFCILWVCLLALSTGYRLWQGVDPEPAPDQLTYRWDQPDDFVEGEYYMLAYRAFHLDAAKTPILLLHGNPMAGSAMLPIAESLGDDHPILIPDLPGMGNSDRTLTAYSAENQIEILLPWLDSLGIRRVHAVGYSQGSATALQFVARDPERVASMTLLGGVGLQSHELLGSYDLNQPIYATYTASLWCLKWLTPHFGLLDRPALNPSTARNFADTDLRVNQAILDGMEQPSLILHSVTDRMVPYAAAKAHARRLPQASFYNLPGGHLGIFKYPADYAEALILFLQEVEDTGGRTRTRAVADGQRDQPGLAVSVPETVRSGQTILIAMLLALLVFFSEDLACISGGILAAGGALPLTGAILGCFAGIWLSDVLLYLLGAAFGPKALELPIIAKAANGRRFQKFKHAYTKQGFRIVFVTRFIPGSRVIAFVTAGVLRVGILRFSVWLAVAAAIWTPILVSFAYLGGRPLIAWWQRSGIVVVPVILLIIGLVIVGARLTASACTEKGRQRLRGRWIRLTQWEFWPAWPVYLPVVVYCIYLSLRYRSALVWGACNPGMYPVSGLALESKLSILQSLNADSGKVACFQEIPQNSNVQLRLKALADFQATLAEAWPIVLKPDIGQRGEGVAIIRNMAAARRYLAENTERIIAQRFVPGLEFGVFYVKHPNAAKGTLFSITEKVLPQLTGDGERSVERLILEDDRAVALADHYLSVNAERLDYVPEKGESIQLVELGTHCRGAVFLDGNRYRSEALLEALETVLATYDGFYFGRFDLRVESPEALMEGRGFQILELNGVSSESTDMYDPKNRLWDAWRILCRQWALAYAIGAANRAQGAKSPRLREVWAVLRGHRARQPYEAGFDAES